MWKLNENVFNFAIRKPTYEEKLHLVDTHLCRLCYVLCFRLIVIIDTMI